MDKEGESESRNANGVARNDKEEEEEEEEEELLVSSSTRDWEYNSGSKTS